MTIRRSLMIVPTVPVQAEQAKARSAFDSGEAQMHRLLDQYSEIL
jgi:hypothetical protein